jgi:hypothetical protein
MREEYNMIDLLSHAVKSFLKGFIGVFLILGILSAIFSSSASANDIDPPVKMSNSKICHAVDSSYYNRTKNFTPFETLNKCIQSGGRLPKNYTPTETVQVATGPTIKKTTVTRISNTTTTGTYTFGPKSEWAGDTYVGQFKDGKFHGQGIYTFGPKSKWAGDTYVGQFVNGKFDTGTI